MVGAAGWARKGVEVPGLSGRIHPSYGVFAPTRLEPARLTARIPDVGGKTVLDVGTGTGVLAALLLARGAASAVATDIDPRATACVEDNARRLGFGDKLRAIPAISSPRAPSTWWSPTRPGCPNPRRLDSTARSTTSTVVSFEAFSRDCAATWLRMVAGI